MKVTLQSTTTIVHVNDIPARVWEGETESGIRVHAYITRIAVHRDEDCSEFDRELQECRPPSAAVAGLDPRLVL